MNKKFIKPNFKNNIINISATLAEFLGCPNDKPTLPILKEELSKRYKNVVFIIFDGMGINPININLNPDTILRKNVKQVLTSVFPSTTTNATTSLLSNKYPMEHGWFGWCLYFEELNRVVDIYLSSDSYTKEQISPDFMQKRLPFVPYYKYAKTDYSVSKVVPEFWHDGNDENRYVCNDNADYFDNIEKICNKKGKQFIYAYCPEPDHTMHEFGVSSKEAYEVINLLNDGIEKLANKLENTLFVITADHGQIDVDGYIEIYKDKELLSMLEYPQFLEARATAFKVKPQFHKNFEKMFNEKYGEDFELVKSKELIKDNYFGGKIISNNAKLLGDYIAIGKTNKIIKLNENYENFKGHHTSLTAEMVVPLILIEKDQIL